MPHIDIRKLPVTRICAPFGRSIKIIMTPETMPEIAEISLTMGIIDPHSKNDLHTHPGTEILYIASGYGKAVIGEELVDIQADSLIIATAGLVHQQINESDETMKMFAIWVPAVTGDEVLGRAIDAAKEF